MSLITKMLRSFVVFWPEKNNDPQGQPLFGPAITLRSRWEDCNEEILTPSGSKELSRARVFVGNQVVDNITLLNLTGVFTEVTLRGMLYQGLYSTLQDTRNPLNNVDALGNLLVFKVIKVDHLPDLKYRNFLRTIFVN